MPNLALLQHFRSILFFQILSIDNLWIHHVLCKIVELVIKKTEYWNKGVIL